jgi:hypothetical protein
VAQAVPERAAQAARLNVQCRVATGFKFVVHAATKRRVPRIGLGHDAVHLGPDARGRCTWPVSVLVIERPRHSILARLPTTSSHRAAGFCRAGSYGGPYRAPARSTRQATSATPRASARASRSATEDADSTVRVRSETAAVAARTVSVDRQLRGTTSEAYRDDGAKDLTLRHSVPKRRSVPRRHPPRRAAPRSPLALDPTVRHGARKPAAVHVAFVQRFDTTPGTVVHSRDENTDHWWCPAAGSSRNPASARLHMSSGLIPAAAPTSSNGKSCCPAPVGQSLTAH